MTVQAQQERSEIASAMALLQSGEIKGAIEQFTLLEQRYPAQP